MFLPGVSHRRFDRRANLTSGLGCRMRCGHLANEFKFAAAYGSVEIYFTVRRFKFERLILRVGLSEFAEFNRL